MDRKTRGIIEEAFDEVLEQDILEVVNWVFRETTVGSQEDLILGYILGSQMRYAVTQVLIGKVYKSAKKQWEKEYGKERAEEIMKWMETSKVKHTRTDLTEKETKQLRNMLIQRLPSYRKKIYRELHR